MDPNRPSYSKGDLIGDGYITTNDATIVRQIYLGTYTNPTTEQLNAADINNNGSVTVSDYAMTNRFVNRTFYFPPTGV